LVNVNAEAVKGNVYVAVVEAYGAGGGKFDDKDRWAISVVNLASGDAATLPLIPKDIAGEWSAAGLGF
jgi:hypothetical protein